jgi:hypothetical protein
VEKIMGKNEGTIGEKFSNLFYEFEIVVFMKENVFFNNP